MTDRFFTSHANEYDCMSCGKPVYGGAGYEYNDYYGDTVAHPQCVITPEVQTVLTTSADLMNYLRKFRVLSGYPVGSELQNKYKSLDIALSKLKEAQG